MYGCRGIEAQRRRLSLIIHSYEIGMHVSLPVPDVSLIVTLLSDSTHDSTQDSADSEYLNSSSSCHSP